MRGLLHILFIQTVLFCGSYAIAQSKNNIDSLKRVVASSSNVQEQLKAYKELIYQLGLKDPEEGKKMANTALSLALQQKDIATYANILKLKGNIMLTTGHRDSALYFLLKAENILSKNDQSEDYAWLLNDLGRFYRRNNPEKAILYYNKAIEIFKKSNNLNGLSTLYNESGVPYQNLGNLKEAIKRFEMSLEIANHQKDSVGISYSLGFLAQAYSQQKQFANAENYLKRAISITQALKDTFATAINLVNIGELYRDEGKPEIAKKYFLQTIDLAKKIHFTDLLSYTYYELSKTHQNVGNYQEAFQYLSLHQELKDSLNNLERSKEVERLTTQFETTQKEKQIQEQQFQLSKRNYLIAAFLILLISGILLSISAYKRIQLKQQTALQELMLSQQKAAAKAVLEAEENERKRIAIELHDSVGQMMSAAKMNLSAIENQLNFNNEQVLRNFKKAVVLVDDSCKEVRNVSHSMMPTALAKAGLPKALQELIEKVNQENIEFHLHVEGFSEDAATNTDALLYRIIQECIQNIIKHAEASIVDIAVVKDDAGISVTVEDNGKGFDTQILTQLKGIGIKNIKSRVELLNGTVEWQSSIDKGTLVAIHLPT